MTTANEDSYLKTMWEKRRRELEKEEQFLRNNPYHLVKQRFFKYQWSASLELAQTCHEILTNGFVTANDRRVLNHKLGVALSQIPMWKAEYEKQDAKIRRGIKYDVLPHDPHRWHISYH
jgi:hypothetical protein